MKYSITKSTAANLSSNFPKRFLVNMFALLELNSLNSNYPNCSSNILNKINPKFFNSFFMNTLNNFSNFRGWLNKSVENSRTCQLYVLKCILSVVWRRHFSFKIKEIVDTFGIISKYSCIILIPMNRILLLLLSSLASFKDNSHYHSF